MKISNKTKGIILLLITAFAWGSGFVARKLGSSVIPPITFNAMRQFGAALVLLPIMLPGLKKSGYLDRSRNSLRRYEFHKYKVLVGGLVCGICMTLASTLQSMGLATVSAGKSGFITSMYVVITPIFSLALGKKLQPKIYGCVALAVVGFGFLSLTEGLGNVHIGDWLLLGSAACFAAQIMAINRYVDKWNDLLLSVIQMALCGVLEIIVAIPLEHPTMAQLTACIPALAYSILIPSALGYSCQVVGQKHASSTSAALILSLESVFSVLVGAIVLHEHMLPRELLGCALIFIAVVASQIEWGQVKLEKVQNRDMFEK